MAQMPSMASEPHLPDPQVPKQNVGADFAHIDASNPPAKSHPLRDRSVRRSGAQVLEFERRGRSRGRRPILTEARQDQQVHELSFKNLWNHLLCLRHLMDQVKH